ncbi:MAG TPA: hypothetical protein ACFYD3_04295 [Candidatus Hypogeohydataceae bacterium YC41]
MSDEINVTANIDQVTLLGPLMAGHILNAFYSNLLLKKYSGIDITPQVKEETLEEVLLLWATIQSVLEKMPRKVVPPKVGG